MGLTEKTERPIFVPDTERTQQIRERLTEDFTNILSNGGIVTGNGTELTQPSDQVIEMLSPELSKEAVSNRVLKLRRNQIKAPLGQQMDATTLGSTRLYLFTPNAIEGLSYFQMKGGSLTPVFVNSDGSIIRPHSDGHHFPTFFVNRARKILQHEDISGSYYRYATTILKELADSKGLGNLFGEKAQSYIKKSKETVK